MTRHRINALLLCAFAALSLPSPAQAQVAPEPGLDPQCSLLSDASAQAASSASLDAQIQKALEEKNPVIIERLAWMGASPARFAGTPWEASVKQMQLARMLVGAAAQGNDTKIKQLVSAGANVNVQANFDEWMSPLIWAARCGNDKSVAVLLSLGAKPNSTGQFTAGGAGLVKNSTPLIWAASFGYADVVRTLLKAGADPNVTEESFLISNGKLEATGKGRTALTASADEKTSALLLKSKADPNIADGHEDTPLILAAARGDLALCRLLLKSGANASLRNKDGMSAVDIAKKNGFGAVAEAIREIAR